MIIVHVFLLLHFAENLWNVYNMYNWFVHLNESQTDNIKYNCSIDWRLGDLSIQK